MPTALTAYYTSTASTTLTTADTLVPTSGTASAADHNTTIGTATGYGEVFAQGNGSAWSGAGSIGSPSGNGWLYDVTTLEGQQIVSGNWTPSLRLSVNAGSIVADIYVRAYKRSSGGTYTLIGSNMLLSAQTITTTHTTFAFSATSQPSVNFSTGDKLYLDMWLDITTNSTGSGTAVCRVQVSTSSTTSSTNDCQVTTPGYQVGGTTIDKETTWRAPLSKLIDKDTTWRGVLSKLVDKETTWRGNIGHATDKETTWRGVLSKQVDKETTWRGPLSKLTDKETTWRGNLSHTVTRETTFRGVLSRQVTKETTWRAQIAQQANKETTWRANLTAVLTTGGFTMWANGTGTASFDHFRVTEYPDPSLSLAPITPLLGASGVSWNASVPTNTTLGIDISYDGVNWTDVTSGNGGALPTYYTQPDPTIDAFTANTSANYTSTFRTGGSAVAATFDTTNSRLILTGGTNGLYLYASLSRADIDFFADLDRSDAGGLVWRFVDQNNFYWLDINDSLTAVGANTITLYKVASNVQTQLGTAAISYTVGPVNNPATVTFTRGTYHRFRISMLGGVITVYVDGVSLITYTDGSPLAAGLMGLVNSGGTIGSRYYQLWLQPQGDYVTGTPSGDTVTGVFVYTRARLSTTDPTVTPQVYDLTTDAFTPDIRLGVSIPSVTYNTTFLSKNFDDLVKQSTNYFWYFTPGKTFVFRPSSIVAAPWILQSAPAGLMSVVDLEVTTNLELDVANDLYRNRQTILGALATGPFTETHTGDGSTRTWTLGYPLAAAPTSITMDGVAKTNIGLKGTTGHDYYYALGDPVIVQDASNVVLQSGDLLAITYSGFYATTVTVDNTAEQAARAQIEGGTGIVEAVEDHTGQNMTQAAATTLATQLINRYALAGRTLIFDTTRNGLAVGQVLTVFLPEQGLIDAQLFITDVEIKLMKGVNDTQIWLYKVTASELPKKASWAKLMAIGLTLT